MKLPIGVADFDSLGAVVIPCDPICAVIAPPYLNHPPPGAFVHACNVAVVSHVCAAVTVITRLADPVEYGSGSATPRCGAGLGFGFGAGAGALTAAFATGVVRAAGVLVGRAELLDTAGLLARALVEAGRAVLVTGAGDALLLPAPLLVFRAGDGVHAGIGWYAGAAEVGTADASARGGPASVRLIPTATIAQPATAAAAAAAEKTRPKDMGPV